MKEKARLVNEINNQVTSIMADKTSLLEEVVKLRKESTDQKDVINDL